MFIKRTRGGSIAKPIYYLQIVESYREKDKTRHRVLANLGRPLTVTEQEGITTYTYDTKPNGKGMIATVTGPNGVAEDYTHDEYSRLAAKTETIDGIDFTESMTYDNYGRLSQLTYPSGFAVTYHYNNYHYLSQVKRADNQAMIWKAEEVNERLQIEQFRSGNNLVTNQSFELGFITGIQTGSIQNLQYNWDMATGNLNWRKDVNRNLKENFTYDVLNRLTSASIEGGTTMNFSYHANGNFESTTPAGTYSYESSRPHAVASVTNPYGLISSSEQVIDYTSFNKVKKITEGLDSLRIYYGADRERRKIEKYEDGSLVLTRYYAHYNYEKDISGSTVTERHYISGSTGLAAIYETKGEEENMYYIHGDHLGSINCITNESGALEEELSFDPWGRRRNPANWTYTGLPSSFIFDRGFTGHEHHDEYGIINMNGRMYDPILGRFLSTDNFVQDPGFTQSYNRYTYCLNNPLIYTDPEGEFIFSLFLGPLGAILDAACWSAAIDAGVQGIKIAAGMQDKFNWAELGGAAIGGAVGGAFAAASPAFTQSILFARYSTKALYSGLTGAAGTGAGMLSTDLLDNGKIDFTGKDYLKGMALGGGLSMGISLGSSAYDYATWDRFSDADKINMLNREFGNTVKLDNSLPYKSGYKFNKSMTIGDTQVSLRSDALATRSMARSLVSHELVHMKDFGYQSLAVKNGLAHKNLSQYIRFTEHNAYTAQLLQASKFNITGNLWIEARNFAQSLYGLNTFPNTFSVWQLIYNIW